MRYMIRRPSKLVIAFILLGVIYLVQVLTVSSNDQALRRYHLSVTQAVLLSLAIVVPYMIIWAIALVGYLRFRHYVRSIRASRDGQAMFLVMCGLFWLLLWLPLNSIAGNLTTKLSSSHPSWSIGLHRADLLFQLSILFLAFVFLYLGSRHILSLRDGRPTERSLLWKQGFYTLYACCSALYIFVIFTISGRRHQPASPYFSDLFLLCLVMVPRLIMWFLGIHAVWNLRAFSRNTVAKIYGEAFKYVAAGVGLVILALVAIGVLDTGNEMSHYSLGSILAIVFVLLVVMAAGWLILARGTGKLERIEQA
jgi:hypothetical protein